MSFDLTTYLGQCRDRVDQALRNYLPIPTGDDALNLGRAMADSVLDGGKRLRPCLTIAACEAVGGKLEDALPASCALEMVHAYSLVHDDLPSMDDDDLRRGNPTCHRKYGEAAAILTGDALLTLAFDVMASAEPRSPDGASRQIAACKELAHAAGRDGMVGGQAIDMAIKEATPSFEALEHCHSLKTAALFVAATTIGGLVGGGSTDQVERLRRYGVSLGLAFQHADDLRDADFPQYKEKSLQRCIELTRQAAHIAGDFGDAGLPLLTITKLVENRAQEAHPK